jgi:hypothetical protein
MFHCHFLWRCALKERFFLILLTANESRSGDKMFAKSIASITPSGKAGLINRIHTVRHPIILPYIHLERGSDALETGSVAINTRPKLNPPIRK